MILSPQFMFNSKHWHRSQDIKRIRICATSKNSSLTVPAFIIFYKAYYAVSTDFWRFLDKTLGLTKTLIGLLDCAVWSESTWPKTYSDISFLSRPIFTFLYSQFKYHPWADKLYFGIMQIMSITKRYILFI